MSSLSFIIHHDMSIRLFGFPPKKDNRLNWIMFVPLKIY